MFLIRIYSFQIWTFKFVLWMWFKILKILIWSQLCIGELKEKKDRDGGNIFRGWRRWYGKVKVIRTTKREKKKICTRERMRKNYMCFWCYMFVLWLEKNKRKLLQSPDRGVWFWFYLNFLPISNLPQHLAKIPTRHVRRIRVTLLDFIQFEKKIV